MRLLVAALVALLGCSSSVDVEPGAAAGTQQPTPTPAACDYTIDDSVGKGAHACERPVDETAMCRLDEITTRARLAFEAGAPCPNSLPVPEAHAYNVDTDGDGLWDAYQTHPSDEPGLGFQQPGWECLGFRVTTPYQGRFYYGVGQAPWTILPWGEPSATGLVPPEPSEVLFFTAVELGDFTVYARWATPSGVSEVYELRDCDD